MSDEKKLISLNELNQAVQDLHPAILDAAVAKAAKVLDPKTEGIMSAKVAEKGITVEDVDAGMETFCGICAKVRPLFNVGMTFAGWVLTASQVAMAKLWLNIVYTKFVDKVCAK